jgi:hypothetical protein
MTPQPIINGMVLRILSARDWLELAREWVAREQARIESSMRRAGADGTEVAKAVEAFAAQHSSYSVLAAMCRTIDGSLAILDRAAKRAGVSREALDEALTGVEPDDVMICAYRCLGFKMSGETDADPNAQSRPTQPC